MDKIIVEFSIKCYVAFDTQEAADAMTEAMAADEERLHAFVAEAPICTLEIVPLPDATISSIEDAVKMQSYLH